MRATLSRSDGPNKRIRRSASSRSPLIANLSESSETRFMSTSVESRTGYELEVDSLSNDLRELFGQRRSTLGIDEKCPKNGSRSRPETVQKSPETNAKLGSKPERSRN